MSKNRHSDTPSPSLKKRKPRVSPSVSKKHALYELFGSDSEDEQVEKRVDKHGNYSMHSYFTRKHPKAYSRQIHTSKQGKYYIVLKTYRVETIETIQLSKLLCLDLLIKNRTDYPTEAWHHVIKFINACRRQINKCIMFSAFDEIEKPTLTQDFYFQDGARKGESSSRDQKKAIKPTTTDHRGKTSASDIFGSDSDDELMVASKPGKKSQPISSYFNKRVATGVSRQTDQTKTGTHFIELKVYNCDEIRNVQPMNRWRHAIITIKNQTNENTKAWEHLSQFIKETRREFKDCRPDILSGCGAYS